MNLQTASINVLGQLKEVLMQMKEENYDQLVPSLDATIGEHVRHILEFYICLFDGLDTGKINYDQRKRDKRIETDKIFAINLIRHLQQKIDVQRKNYEALLELKYGDKTDQNIRLKTNYERELAYNIEHTIHHLAIIKQGLKEMCHYITLPENFGIASSTVRYMKQG
jgi:hypothetical protein